ncbi:MAG: TIR domain-containing protein [Bacteroidia bacterium]|nr:TIR domain-containing protein [Bacteroidia bacterium]
MKKKVFISYEFGDASFAGVVKQWLYEIGAEPLLIKRKDITPETAKESEKAILEYISEASLMLVLVGNNVHNSAWIAYEVDVAQSKQTPIRWVRLPNRSGAPPKELFNTAEALYKKGTLHQLLNSLNIVP